LQCASNSPPSVWRYYERNKSPQKDTLAAFLPQTENWELDSAYPHAEMGKPEDKAPQLRTTLFLATRPVSRRRGFFPSFVLVWG
jgi:hypothetical protein